VFEDIIKNIKKPIHEIKTLEVGCGGARVSVFLAKKGMKVTCTDFSPEALRLAEANFKKENLSNYTVVQDDLLSSKLPAESFDVVMSFGLLEHFSDLDPPFKAMTHLLKPGGIHIHDIITKRFTIANVAKIWNTLLRFFKRLLLLRWKNIFSESYHYFPHYENSYPLSDYVKVLEKTGAKIVYQGGMVIWPFFALPKPMQRWLVQWANNHKSFFYWCDRKGHKWMEIIAPSWWLVGQKL